MSRTSEEIRRYYEIEKMLAARLRTASREERPALYRSVYDELFRLVPEHPQLVRKHSPEQARNVIAAQIRRPMAKRAPFASWLGVRLAARA